MQNLSMYLQLLQNLCEQKNIITENREKFRPDTYPFLIARVLSLQKLLLKEAQILLDEEAQPFLGDEFTIFAETEAAILPEEPNDEGCNPDTMENSVLEFEETGTSQAGDFSLDVDADITENNVDVTIDDKMKSEDIQPEVEESREEAVVVQTGVAQWAIPDGKIICQTQDIIVTRDGEAVPIRFSIAPLQVVRDGLVPVMANAEYQSFTINQTTTFMSEENESLLQMDVDRFTFLIKGSFTNGVFGATIMSTGRSVDNGDVVEVKAVRSNSGTAAAPEIRLHDNATLWIAFDSDSFFGVLHSGEWTDEFNASHDVMIEVDGDCNELKVTHDNGWVLRY